MISCEVNQMGWGWGREHSDDNEAMPYHAFKNCLPCVVFVLKESIAQFGLNNLDECLAICKDVCEKAKDSCSDNEPFLQTKALYISSAVYRQKGQFDMADKLMDLCIQVLYFVLFKMYLTIKMLAHISYYCYKV